MAVPNPLNAGFDDVRAVALSLPEVVEGRSYGTPAFGVGKKFFARMHQDGQSLVLKMDFENREFLMQISPEIYYITEHYRNYPNVLVHLSAINADELKRCLELAWRQCAPKRLINEYVSKR